MKILWVFNHLAPYKVRLFNELAKHADLEVVFERDKEKSRPDSFYYLNEYNFKYTVFKKGYFGERNTYSNELKKFIKKNHTKYDLIVMNGFSTISEIKAISFLNKNKHPFVFYINGGIPHKECFLKKKLKKKMLKGAVCCFSPSEVADQYLLQYINPLTPIHHYTYSTIEAKDIAKDISEKEKEEIRKKYNLPSGRLFVNFSQFIERKNNLFLLEIFKELNDNLLLIGSGKEKEQYKKYIKDNNMNNVTILDFMEKEKLFEILRACDFHITLSKEDIYGHTINEAMCNGLPVIASSHITGAKSLIKNGENGFVVDLNKEIIVTAIKTINKSMGEKAIETAKNNTLEKSVEMHLELFKEIMK